MRLREAGALLARTLHEWIEDKAPKQAAALTYYALFAIGPLLVFCIFVAGLVFGADAARGAILAQFASLLGAEGASALADMMNATGPRGSSVVAIVVGSVVLLAGAMGVFAQLKEALNTVWEIVARKRTTLKDKVLGAVRKNLFSFAGLLGAAFLLTITLVVSAGVAAAGAWLKARYPAGDLFWQVVVFVVGLALLVLVFALLYRYVPDARVAWKDVLVGATATAILFNVGEMAIGAYLGRSGVATRYGTGGAVLLILLWIYYSSLILFFGAELTQVYANRHGARVRPDPRQARPLQEAVRDEHAPPDREGAEDAPPRAPRRRGPAA